VLEETQLMRISVVDTDPVRAALVANIVVAVFAEQNQADQAKSYATSKANLQEQMDKLDEQIQADTAYLNNLGSAPETQAEREQINSRLAQYRQAYAYLLQSREQVNWPRYRMYRISSKKRKLFHQLFPSRRWCSARP